MQLTKSLAAHLGLAAALGMGVSTATAQDKPAGQSGWETVANAGATLTRGNSETFLGTLGLDTKRKWTNDEVLLGASAGYGEATVNGENQKNTEYVKGYGQYNHLFNQRLYGGLRVDAEYDGIAGVDHRVRLSPLLGYYVVKNPRTSLGLEIGPSAVFEKLKDKDEDTYLGFRAGERFEHKLTDTTKIWQSFEYIPNVNHWGQRYLLNGEAGIAADITKQLSLRLVFQDNFNSQPSAGRKENDLRLIAGVGYKF